MTLAAQRTDTVNYKAVAWTIGIHVLLLLLFFFIQYQIHVIPETRITATGNDLNLGNSENGSGHDQPQSKEDPGAYSATVMFASAEEKAQLPQNMMRSNDADAADLNDPSEHPKNDNPNKNDNKADQQHPIAKYTYGGTNGLGGNSAKDDKKGTNEGITHGPGDQGGPGGDPNGHNYNGTPGTGGAIGHNLAGRDMYPKQFEAEFHESGKVVIHVTVDRDGRIVEKYVKSTSSHQLDKIAMDKLAGVKFSKSTGSAPQQFGDVTFVFKTR